MAAITGWGRGTWGEEAFGEPLPVVVSGVSGDGQIGAVFFGGDQRIMVTGVEADAEAGALREVVRVTGLQASVETNRVLVWGKEIPNPETVWSQAALGLETTWSEDTPSPETIWTEIAA